MSQEPSISLIICTYNRAEYLSDSLNTLIQSARGRSVEILVIDNNSSDNTRKVCQEYSAKTEKTGDDLALHYVLETNQGLSFARNRGIEEANAPVIIFLDDDITVPSSFTDSWLSFFADHPEARAAGGKIHVQFDDPRPKWMSDFLLPLLGHHDHGDSIKPYSNRNYPFGGNMAFKAGIFDEYGTFNTELGRIGSDLKASEEKEFFRRLQQDGVKIYFVPKALLYHRVNKSRLTKDYIRRQAVGLGQSIALQMKRKPGSRKITTIFKEVGKWAATIALFIFYSFKLQGSKGVMLLKFRYWILQGISSLNRT
ncbi:glycosyltransferase [Rhodohalobacter sp. 8-1]|uniref:glycosyltransferase n=1 Tax=Rhodohalobacter sp. 8-1 TaxID=3131972 RepID=UPI0030ECB734